MRHSSAVMIVHLDSVSVVGAAITIASFISDASMIVTILVGITTLVYNVVRIINELKHKRRG